MGGVVPLGYRVLERKLVSDEAEAETVQLIFERYITLGSMLALMEELRERGIVTRQRALASGRTIGGISFTKGPLAHLLKNRTYLGELNHHGGSYPADHAAYCGEVREDFLEWPHHLSPGAGRPPQSNALRSSGGRKASTYFAAARLRITISATPNGRRLWHAFD